MPRWLRIVRGMLGTGLVFSVGAGIVATLVGLTSWLIVGGPFDPELFLLIAGAAAWAFPVGVVFSGGLAILGRGRTLDRLSLPGITALGAGGGLLLFGALALNAWDAWTIADAIGNAVILVSMGAGAAATSLVLARRATPELEPPEEAPPLEPGTTGG